MLQLVKERHSNAQSSMYACVIKRVNKQPVSEFDALLLGAAANDAPTTPIVMSQRDHLTRACTFVDQINRTFGNEKMTLKTNFQELAKHVLALGIGPVSSSNNPTDEGNKIGIASLTKVLKLGLLAQEDDASVAYIQMCRLASRASKKSGKAFSMEGLSSPALFFMQGIPNDQESGVQLFILQTGWEWTGCTQADGAAQRLKGGRDSRVYAHMIHFVGVVLKAIAFQRAFKRRAAQPGSWSPEGALITTKTTAVDLLQQTRRRAPMTLKEELANLFISKWHPDEVWESCKKRTGRDEASLVHRRLLCR